MGFYSRCNPGRFFRPGVGVLVAPSPEYHPARARCVPTNDERGEGRGFVGEPRGVVRGGADRGSGGGGHWESIFGGGAQAPRRGQDPRRGELVQRRQGVRYGTSFFQRGMHLFILARDWRSGRKLGGFPRNTDRACVVSHGRVSTSLAYPGNEPKNTASTQSTVSARDIQLRLMHPSLTLSRFTSRQASSLATTARAMCSCTRATFTARGSGACATRNRWSSAWIPSETGGSKPYTCVPTHLLSESHLSRAFETATTHYIVSQQLVITCVYGFIGD